MFYPDLQKVKELSSDYSVIPVVMEVYADMETPISLFKRFSTEKACFLLESVEGGEKWARYSFIGRDPFLALKAVGGKVYITGKEGEERVEEGNPVKVLQQLMERYRGPDLPELPRFNGGAVGFFGYDLIRHYEQLPQVPQDDLELPECHFLFVDEVLAFDHLKQKILIIVNVHTDGNIDRNYYSAVERIKDIYREILSSRWKINDNVKPEFSGGSSIAAITGNIGRQQYCENVEQAKEYIRNGDIFQVVLSQRLSTEAPRDLFNVYRALRIINPSPYMYYIQFDGYSLIGSSPEMLVRVDRGVVETCPIAGTRKRGGTPEEDRSLEQELLQDEKERAEHTMLVDLGRNDIGRVSAFGSVTVRDPMHVERYSHVMHLVTNVAGKLAEGKNAFDALMSVLPAGTVSGAPKVRAMEIIDELESTKRGPYAGAIGYLGFNGSLDSCITIRTILIHRGKAYVQAGAGIVADSDPEKEYEETLNKARALLKAIEEAGEIL